MQTPSMTEITAIRIPIYKDHVHYNQSTYYAQVPVADGTAIYSTTFKLPCPSCPASSTVGVLVGVASQDVKVGIDEPCFVI